MDDGVNRPAWVDLSSPDPAASRAFYSRLFGWDIEVNPDPQYGGYAIAKLNGKDAAGIGPQQPGAPTAWALYIGTRDAASLGEQVQAAGGTVLAPAFDIGEQGRMAVFADPTGAVISAWQPAQMGGFQSGGTNAFGWAELNSRDLNAALPFYRTVFGWATHESSAGGMQYVELHDGADSIAGAQPMNPMVPEGVPGYWQVYFNVADVDASYRTALDAGAREMLAPMDFPGGRFAIIADPQGATVGLLRLR
jgi:predicted enzyme related to lactoylglutathione lyase